MNYTCHLSAPELDGSEYFLDFRGTRGLTGELLFHRIPGLGFGLGGLQGKYWLMSIPLFPSLLQGGWRLRCAGAADGVLTPSPRFAGILLAYTTTLAVCMATWLDKVLR